MIGSVMVCEECGAVVVPDSAVTHTNWHDDLELSLTKGVVSAIRREQHLDISNTARTKR